jgi:hypothetical protein
MVSTRSAALRVLERRAYTLVVMDQQLSEADPEGADLVWKHAGLAMPLQFSFALSGSERLEREIRTAVARRGRERELAGAAALAELDSELKNDVTGLLLESELALAAANVSPEVAGRLQRVRDIAERMRSRLSRPVAGEASIVTSGGRLPVQNGGPGTVAERMPTTAAAPGGLRAFQS